MAQNEGGIIVFSGYVNRHTPENLWKILAVSANECCGHSVALRESW
jgi:hypothetical protein